MPTFDERVRRAMEPDLRDLRELFLDDQVSLPEQEIDLGPVMGKLDDVLQWVKNVKSEVQKLEKSAAEQDKKDEEEEDPEKKRRKYDDQQREKRRKLLEDSLRKISDKMLPGAYDMITAILLGIEDALDPEGDGKVLDLPFFGGTNPDNWETLPDPESPLGLPPPQEAPNVRKDFEELKAVMEYLIQCCHSLPGRLQDSRLPYMYLPSELRRYAAFSGTFPNLG